MSDRTEPAFKAEPNISLAAIPHWVVCPAIGTCDRYEVRDQDLNAITGSENVTQTLDQATLLASAPELLGVCKEILSKCPPRNTKLLAQVRRAVSRAGGAVDKEVDQ